MDDVFLAEDLAIGSYRHAVSETIPEITRIAWRDKREEIQKLNPGAAEEKFVFNLSRAGIRQGLRHRLPEAGPAGAVPRASSTSCCRRSARCGRCSSRRRPRKPRRCFSRASRARASAIAAALDALGRGRLDLPNTDFDTGKPSAHGEYSLADETYAELLDRLTGDRHADRARRAARQHQRVLRRAAEAAARQERAEARRRDQGTARAIARTPRPLNLQTA